MRKKVSDKQILEALELYEDKETDAEIAVRLGIAKQTLSQRLTRLRPKINAKAIELAERKAMKAVQNLIKQSDEGKTAATALLLEIGKVKTKENLLDIPGNWRIQIEKIEPKALE